MLRNSLKFPDIGPAFFSISSNYIFVMKKLIPTLLFAACFATFLSAQTAGLVLYADSLQKEEPVDQSLIDVPDYLFNYSGQNVLIKWTRTLEQPFPNGWLTNFCDDSLCYLNQTSTAQFYLSAGDTGLLKPVFYPYGNLGTGIMRVKVESLTPDVPFLAHIVYIAVATPSTGTTNLTALRNGMAVFPNPAKEEINIVFVDPDFRGALRITDATGRIVQTHTGTTAQEHLDLSGLPTGFYSLQAWSDSGRLVAIKGFAKL